MEIDQRQAEIFLFQIVQIFFGSFLYVDNVTLIRAQIKRGGNEVVVRNAAFGSQPTEHLYGASGA